MATRIKAESELPNFSPDYSGILDKVERGFKLNGSSNGANKFFVSTGLLMSDFIMGGGLQPGCWVTFYGGEQSAKSTHMMHVIDGTLSAGVETSLLFDYEGSTSGSPDYFENVLRSGLTSNEVFGLRDDNGNWVVRPRVRLYVEDVAETFFNSMASLLRSLPDKVYIHGQWYYVYKNTNENRKIVSESYSKKLFSEYKQFFVPAPDGRPQALIFLDSYPAMITEREDDDDVKSGMAANARMFSENVRKVSSKLKRKAVTLVGINQIRLRPAVMHQNPEYEPGGETLKFASSIRIRQSGRSVPHASGPVEEEKAIWASGGTEKYRYIHMRAVKNKVATPNLESFFRLCFEDSFGQSTGFDPVYDTFSYLKATGQLSGTMKKLKIEMPGFSTKGKTIFWEDFKALNLLTGQALRDYCKDMKLEKTVKLRDICFKQMRDRTAFNLYYETKRAKPVDDDED